MNKSEISEYIEEGVLARSSVDVDLIERVGHIISAAFSHGNKIFLMGNGGSAADSQHIAAEFVGRFETDRRPLPALALNTNTSSITAISNDYSYEKVFERQIEAFARKDDVVIGISTSGNSKNIVAALEAAKKMGCYCVSLTGLNGGKVSEFSDINIKVDSKRTSIIQEVHIAIGHIWSKIVEDELFKR